MIYRGLIKEGSFGLFLTVMSMSTFSFSFDYTFDKQISQIWIVFGQSMFTEVFI